MTAPIVLKESKPKHGSYLTQTLFNFEQPNSGEIVTAKINRQLSQTCAEQAQR